MTKIRVVFEFEIVAYSNVPDRAEQKIKDFVTSGDSLIDIAGVYSKDKGGPWIRYGGGYTMTTKKDCIERAARERNDRDFSQRIADRAEEVNYRGYEAMLKEGKALFAKDLEELREASA